MDTMIGIQIDLKYNMYEKGYLLDLLDKIKSYGINTILLEYEDKFPYRKYPFLKADDAFTPAELKAFLHKARSNNLRVIPLVQSLSHMEFALDHPELAHLSEAPDIPTQICPSNPESVEFIFDLIREVLEYHQEDEFFHCGADETWFLGTCGKCADWKSEKGIIKMWAEHEKKILDFVIGQGKRPIVWDDIFWKDFESINSVDIPKQTVLMCWNYNITSLRSKSDSNDSEFGGSGELLKQIGIYRNAGYDCIGCPCCNYGQIFPRHSTSLANTKVWAQKSASSDMLGVINSSWACFHTPLQCQLPFFSATAELLRDPELKIDELWH
ncbi:MAG: family 20 glycosylhydrolase, partial [Lentisphaerota bacterium]